MYTITFWKGCFSFKIFPSKVGIEGTGFEPTIEALFGENGFFPDSISKVMYWAGDNSQMLKKILDRLAPNRDRARRQVKAIWITHSAIPLVTKFYHTVVHCMSMVRN